MLKNSTKKIIVALRDDRSNNSFIDGILILLLTYVIIVYVLKLDWFGTENGYTFFIYLFITFIYYFLLESFFNRTPAKFFTKSRVVSRNGKKPTMKQLFVRSFVRLVPFEWVTFLFSSNPIGLHDKLSGTVVITEKYKTSQKQATILESLHTFTKIILYCVIAIFLVLLLVFIAVITYRYFIIGNL